MSVVAGLVLVGLSNINSYNARFAPRPLIGNTLVIIGQLFLAGMFVYEEKILKEYDVHVFEIVGWEGVWGMLISAMFLGLFYYIPGTDVGSYENPIQATQQILNNFQLLFSVALSTLVIGPFNYYGTNLTKYSSAMHRCLIDASRMCIVWLTCLFCGWEMFKLQQCLGYVAVLIGNLIYYEILNFNTKPLEEQVKRVPIKAADEKGLL